MLRKILVVGAILAGGLAMVIMMFPTEITKWQVGIVVLLVMYLAGVSTYLDKKAKENSADTSGKRNY